MEIKVKKNTWASVFWTVSVAAYMFQCYQRNLAILIVPCLAMFLFIESNRIRFQFYRNYIPLYCFFFLYLTTSGAISYVNGTPISSILRFYLILLAIPLAQCVTEPDFNSEWTVLKVLATVKASTVVLTWMAIFIKQDYQSYRMWAQSTGAGDIYILNGIPRVQILGTSIFVTLFVCEFMKEHRLTFYGALMAVTALAAGNSAYVLGIFSFGVFYYGPVLLKWIKNKNWKLIFVIPISIAMVIVFALYSLRSMKAKAEFSNAVRVEQIQVLTETNPIIGNGLGHSVSGGGVWRQYDGDTYFELQTLYIYNQIGIIGLGTFYLLSLIPYTGQKNRKKLMCYITYLIYTFFNPYCFDSTHIIAVLLISNCVDKNCRIASSGSERLKK